jgi:membrane protease YdiL (CAAX protease family)
MNHELKMSLIRILPFIVLIAVVSIRIKQGKFTKQELFIQKPQPMYRFFAWVFAFLVFILTTEFILFKNDLLEVAPWNHTLLPSILRITGAVLFAPIAEELLFRGILLGKLTQNNRVNLHLAVFIQAVLFVVVHNFAYENTFTSNLGIAQTFLDACLFAYAKIHTKSIYTPMAMHMSGNIIATLERFIL